MPGAARVQSIPINEIPGPVSFSPRTPKSHSAEDVPHPTPELGPIFEQTRARKNNGDISHETNPGFEPSNFARNEGDMASETSSRSNVFSITSAMVDILQVAPEVQAGHTTQQPPVLPVLAALPEEANPDFPKRPSAWRAFLNRVSNGGRQGSKQSKQSKKSNENECSICLEGFDKYTCPRLMDVDEEASCSVSFEVPDSEPCVVTFRRKPLGMVAFVNRDPATVSAVVTGSAAEALGVQEGWIIRRVEDVDVTDFTFAKVFEVLREKTASLPMQSVRCGGCNMKFHCDCLQNWVVKGSNSCPMCRSNNLPLSVNKTRPPRHISDFQYDVEISLDALASDSITQPNSHRWSTPLGFTAYMRMPVESAVAACLCPCITADTNWSAVVNHSGTSSFPLYHFVSFIMGFTLLMAISSLVLPGLFLSDECNFPNAASLFFTFGRKFRGKCYMYELSWTISTLSSWLAFVSSLVLYRQHVAMHFDIVYGGATACLCQCCGCYSCTLLQEQAHTRVAVPAAGQGDADQAPADPQPSEALDVDLEAPPAAAAASWSWHQPNIGAPVTATQQWSESLATSPAELERPEPIVMRSFVPA